MFSIKNFIFKATSLIAVICALGTMEAYGSPASGKKIIPTNRNAQNVLTENRLRNDIAFLSDTLCKGRGTGNNTEAAFWIARRMAGFGLVPFGGSYSQSFNLTNGKIGHNILAMLPGTSDNYIIVAAHYDHLGILGGKMFPGADSNASGVAAMLSLANMFRSMHRLGKNYTCNIIFVAFDAKELNMNGSQHFWDILNLGWIKNPVTGATITKNDISLMVNIDQIGSTLSPLKSGSKDYLIMLPGKNDYYGDILRNCNSRLDIGLEIATDYYGSKDFTKVFYNRVSDQKVFVGGKVPAVLFTSGITMNNNKPIDTVDTLDMSVLKKRVWLIFNWLDELT